MGEQLDRNQIIDVAVLSELLLTWRSTHATTLIEWMIMINGVTSIRSLEKSAEPIWAHFFIQNLSNLRKESIDYE